MPTASRPDAASARSGAAGQDFAGPAIVIGGSAGSVEALRILVESLPDDLEAAVLVVVHQPAFARSQLHAVLQSVSRLPVSLAADGEQPRPGHIYVATPDRHLVLKDGVLRLTSAPRECHVRPAINVLFRSAAMALGPRVAGVVLSGVLDDGTAGLWAIKDHGGTAYAQDPDEALHPPMPRSAIEHVAIDGVHPVEALAAELAAWAAAAARTTAAVGASAHDALHRYEVDVAAGGPRSAAQLFSLADPSTFTCPDCHGALAEIREGPIVRFRCHTGHAYSLRVLLEQLGVHAEEQLWGAMRALDEKQMLLARIEPHDEGSAQPSRAAALTQAVQDVRVLAQGQAAHAAADLATGAPRAMAARAGGRGATDWQDVLALAESAAVRLAALEAAAERQFNQPQENGEPGAGDAAAVALRREDLDTWLAARRATDAAWGHWAELLKARLG